MDSNCYLQNISTMMNKIRLKLTMRVKEKQPSQERFRSVSDFQLFWSSMCACLHKVFQFERQVNYETSLNKDRDSSSECCLQDRHRFLPPLKDISRMPIYNLEKWRRISSDSGRLSFWSQVFLDEMQKRISESLSSFQKRIFPQRLTHSLPNWS